MVSQNVNHAFLQDFYNGFILHQNFIIEVMFVELKKLRLTGKEEIHDSLYVIKNQLEHLVARLFYALSFECTNINLMVYFNSRSTSPDVIASL